jgi:hypothetical protein
MTGKYSKVLLKGECGDGKATAPPGPNRRFWRLAVGMARQAGSFIIRTARATSKGLFAGFRQRACPKFSDNYQPLKLKCLAMAAATDRSAKWWNVFGAYEVRKTIPIPGRAAKKCMGVGARNLAVGCFDLAECWVFLGGSTL